MDRIKWDKRVGLKCQEQEEVEGEEMVLDLYNSARENRDIKKGFIWIPQTGPIIVDILISGISVYKDVMKAEFTKALCPEMGMFKISLINSDGKYSDKYVGQEIIQLYVDRGSTGKLITVTGEAQEVTITEGTDRL